MLKGTAMRDKKGKGRGFRRKWSKRIFASLPATSICIYFGFSFACLCILEMWDHSRFILIFHHLLPASLGFYIHYNAPPGFSISVFRQLEREGASACVHLHRALWRLKFRLNRCFFLLLKLCLACVWQICCINSQGRPGAELFVERQITHQSFI